MLIAVLIESPSLALWVGPPQGSTLLSASPVGGWTWTQAKSFADKTPGVSACVVRGVTAPRYRRFYPKPEDSWHKAKSEDKPCQAKPRRVPRREWLFYHPEIKGVFVGGCCQQHGNGKHVRILHNLAHAHIHDTSSRGWICFRDEETMADIDTWLHEAAHIITRSAHTKRFWKCLEALREKYLRDTVKLPRFNDGAWRKVET